MEVYFLEKLEFEYLLKSETLPTTPLITLTLCVLREREKE
jgi:hypothetical protein